MKRIDDKIKEIEKRDKTNRLLYMGFVVLIAGIMGYVYVTEMRNKRNIDTISDLEIKQTETYKALELEKENSEKLYDDLKKSLSPEEYWNSIKVENSVESYIGYITNDWGIDKGNYLPEAIANLKSTDLVGFKGWLFVGSVSNDDTYSSRDIVEVVYRENAEGDISDSQVQIGDVVQLKTTRNRKTYSNKRMSGANTEGWRNKTKAFVVDTWKDPNSINYNIEIRYY
jgi:hypothetical protein